jgi:Deoxyribonuclease NucA/NucB
MSKKRYVLALLALGCIAFTARMSIAQTAEEQTVAPEPGTNQIEGEVFPNAEAAPPDTPISPEQGAPEQGETQAIAAPAPAVATFDTTVIKSPLTLQLSDSSAVDGDIVRVTLNGSLVRDVALTAARQGVDLKLQPGANKIRITALNEGSTPPNTVRINYPNNETLKTGGFERPQDLATGRAFETTVGLPQIAICATVVKFPCLGNPYPESSQHVLEALGIPPQPISTRFVPTRGKRDPNPLRPSYPRFLTIDRGLGGANRRARQRASVRNYECPNSRLQDRDEYPQAAFAENLGSAHIKCIDQGDNKGSGSTIGTQINFYRESATATTLTELKDSSMIEFVVLP